MVIRGSRLHCGKGFFGQCAAPVQAWVAFWRGCMVGAAFGPCWFRSRFSDGAVACQLRGHGVSSSTAWQRNGSDMGEAIGQCCGSQATLFSQVPFASRCVSPYLPSSLRRTLADHLNSPPFRSLLHSAVPTTSQANPQGEATLVVRRFMEAAAYGGGGHWSDASTCGLV